MSTTTERYRSPERMGLQEARPVRGRYEIHSPLEPVRSGWTFDYRPAWRDEPDRGTWVLWDENGREVYREPGYSDDRATSLGPDEVRHDPSPDNLAAIGLLSSLVVPWRLGASFSLGDALWRRIDDQHGLLLTPSGEPMLHVTLDEHERTRQLRAQSADGSLLVAWEPSISPRLERPTGSQSEGDQSGRAPDHGR